MHSIFFVSHGEFGFCFPEYENAIYYKVKTGTMVGFEDYPHRLRENKNNIS